MIRLYLVRHAAEEGPRGLKRLGPRARARFRGVARTFADAVEPIARVCSSPRPHAVQTAEILAAAVRRDDVALVAGLSPRGDLDELVAWLARHARAGRGVALVSHRRQLLRLLSALGVPESALPKLPKGGLLRVDVDALPSPSRWAIRYAIDPREAALESTSFAAGNAAHG